MAELWDGNKAVNRITVRDLLGMTSGIADYVRAMACHGLGLIG